MKSKEALGVMAVLEGLPDPRSRKCFYPLEEILLTAICAVLSGAEDWCSVAGWGRLKLEWLRTWLPFERGMASHDTFRRIFCLLKAEHFEANFMTWMKGICPALTGKHGAIDGKTVRGSRDGERRGIHLVSAWCSEYGMTLGQIRTEEKRNEITAIPQLIDALGIEGATVTIDALGCQHRIAKKIIDRKANYIWLSKIIRQVCL